MPWMRRVRGALLLAAALLVFGPAALAQSTPAPGSTDVTSHLPSGTWLLIVVGLALAGYLSYRLGHKSADMSRRREGPISRALNDRGRT